MAKKKKKEKEITVLVHLPGAHSEMRWTVTAKNMEEARAKAKSRWPESTVRGLS